MIDWRPMPTLRHWLFRHFGPIAVVLSAAAALLVALNAATLKWELVLTGTTAWLSAIYFVQKQRLEELKLFKELFTEFNERYDRLNHDLSRIAEGPSDTPLSADDKAALVDYFNLCGEEFLYYRLGYIYPEVWRAWLNGMRFYFANSRIGVLWSDELGTDSYYGLSAHLLEPGVPLSSRPGHQSPAVPLEDERLVPTHSLTGNTR